MPRGDGLDNATFDDFVGELRRRPVGHWATTLLGDLARHADDLRQLLCRKLGRRTRSLSVSQQLMQQLGQVLVGHAFLLGKRQTLLVLSPAHPPAPDALPVYTEPTGLLDVAHTIR